MLMNLLNMAMKSKAALALLEQLYPLLRPILFNAINDPKVEWDDIAMMIADRLFNYKA